MNRLNYLNLGCGSQFHPHWYNVDLNVKNENVIKADLKNGIPFDDQTFEVVYHSHILEHFSKEEGVKFMKECYRVLKPGGMIRIAVPDLEKIVREYIRNLELSLEGDVAAPDNYDWILLELYDQTVREKSGGEMLEYLSIDQINNLDYIYSRIGIEGKTIREGAQRNRLQTQEFPGETKKTSSVNVILKNLVKVFHGSSYINLLKKILFKKEFDDYRRMQEQMKIVNFRQTGEIHAWMYDRFSLSRLLKESGFSRVSVLDAFSSQIPLWESYQLDVLSGQIRKPDSIFVEAMK